MYASRLLLLLALVAPLAMATPPDGDGVTWVAPKDPTAIAAGRPTIVYFGAEWCPPCRVFETEIFNQQDVHAALAPFDTVYVDGDRIDARAFMTPMNVMGFPAVVALAADGKEAGRYLGTPKKSEFIRFLAEAARPDRSMAMVDKLVSGASLNAAEWRVLSDLEVTDVGGLPTEESGDSMTLPRLRDRLAAVVSALDAVTPPLPAAVADRIRVKALLVDAVAKAPVSDPAALRTLVDRVLATPATMKMLSDEFVYYSQEMLDHLHPEAAPAKRVLAGKLLAAMEDEVERSTTDRSWQVEVMLMELPLLPVGSNDIDADRKKLADRVEAILKDTAEPKKRLALAVPAARLLRLTGHEFRAEAVIRQTLAVAPDAFYLNDGLIDFARKRGDLDALVRHGEAAFRGASRNPASVVWGAQWVDTLIERDPLQADAIDVATDEVLRVAIASGHAFKGFSALAMTGLATSLDRHA